jgi:uncharacterized cofD-like protein
MKDTRALGKWFSPGIGLKRWVVLLIAGLIALASGIAFTILDLQAAGSALPLPYHPLLALALVIGGTACFTAAFLGYSNTILAPYRAPHSGSVIEQVYSYSRRQKGIRVVAIGGGTGLPATLRALKPYTSNITAVVTVADDGGSSGRLRRELGVLPPGDLRNNIAALADDESLMTQLFQHRFESGNLGGHAFGNLFITALASVTGSLESALIETGRVLNIQGQVFPATLEDVDLVADVRLAGKRVTISGESRITAAGGVIEVLRLRPPHVEAYAGSVQAILNADIVVLGPGSLYTSILPNLLVEGIHEALRATPALKVYVCNIATQPGETEGFTVAEHIVALESALGRGVLQGVLANSSYPVENAGANTRYVMPAPPDHEVTQRYQIWYTDLVDEARPWRHDPHKLAAALLRPEGAGREFAAVKERDTISTDSISSSVV